MCDDVFDDAIPEEETAERLWLKTSSNLQKDGYREGLEAGTEVSLQDGFNEGFALSGRLLFNIAELRGEISGILSLNLMKGKLLDKSTEHQLEELLGFVVLYETEVLNYSRSLFEKLRSQYSKENNSPEKGAIGHHDKEINDSFNLEKININENYKKHETPRHGKTMEDTGSVSQNSFHVPEDTKLLQFKDRLKQIIN